MGLRMAVYPRVVMGGGVSGATLRWPTLVWAATTAGFGIGTGPGIRPLDFGKSSTCICSMLSYYRPKMRE
ncbi:hypothetical protein PR003_g29527 [Phytophthora rubi]|uniref:Uncharacterized protein n=1 Tax=Phytophthora rubi TaxID=129364 RepID=A0A6A3H9Q5_9STRA|nr:hypothetical protein PR001_g28671 [Phytophthora rubi]KAE8965887.1 hypothetical protein PR002_g28541 [Phytophthora rubi]KAE9274712.1 hypothetical protein PR003_g29527 [Phytophthora rubi]